MNKQPDIEKIYTEFRGPLKAFISKHVPDRFSAEDLLHDVFLRIHNQIGSLKQKEKLAPWIYQIARNAIIDTFRKERVTVEPSNDLISTDQFGINDITEKLIPLVRMMVQRLPGKYQEALFLADFQGIKHGEIAERLGISLSAVKSRVQRARSMLKELLLNCCHFEFDLYGTVFDYHPKNCSNCCEENNNNCLPAKRS
jgi:RNA polymerase sigma-70 factor, ECF subfamily